MTSRTSTVVFKVGPRKALDILGRCLEAQVAVVVEPLGPELKGVSLRVYSQYQDTIEAWLEGPIAKPARPPKPARKPRAA